MENRVATCCWLENRPYFLRKTLNKISISIKSTWNEQISIDIENNTNMRWLTHDSSSIEQIRYFQFQIAQFIDFHAHFENASGSADSRHTRRLAIYCEKTRSTNRTKSRKRTSNCVYFECMLRNPLTHNRTASYSICLSYAFCCPGMTLWIHTRRSDFFRGNLVNKWIDCSPHQFCKLLMHQKQNKKKIQKINDDN